MPHSAEASAETLSHTQTAAAALPHRQEAFARHVASGHSLTEAARLAGYAWDSARQTGSRLMKERRIAARAADLAYASDNQRQGELDELVSALKRLMIDAMARENDFAALRAIDMIARLRGLVPNTAKRSDGLEMALGEVRRQQPETHEPETGEPEAGEETEAEDTVFDPPMPPELRMPVEPAPASAPEPPSPAQSRHSASEAARAAVRRRLFHYEHLMDRHPELSGKIRDLSDAQLYFDEDDNLLPPELWPNGAHPGPTPEALRNDDI